MDQQGLLLCAKYSSAPNFFGYCGPPKNSALIDHLRVEMGDKEVENILTRFESLYLNLKLIAFENKIYDPFDKRVVEAYWIGNNLLKNIKSKDYVALLEEKFKLEHKTGKIKFGKLKHKLLSNRILPHHSFHVFNIFKRTGHDQSFHTLDTMDSCRIGWGRVEEFSIFNSQFSLKSKFPKIKIKTKQLSINNQQLTLNKWVEKELNIDFKGKSYIKDFKVGDWLSYHWGFVCDKLSPDQVENLEYYTKEAVNFYNTPL